MKHFHIHPSNPQARLLAQAVEVLNQKGLMVYPTDATYALGCKMDCKEALERIYALKKLEKDHRLTLVCQDLADLSQYAQVNNRVFRLLKKYTPGPYTFILPGSPDLPRRLADPKRKTIGLRIPNHPVVQALLSALAMPLLSSTAQLPGDELPLASGDEIQARLAKQVDLFLDAGAGSLLPTTIVDLTADEPRLVRLGCGVEIQQDL